jgi:hypothetical protein
MYILYLPKIPHTPAYWSDTGTPYILLHFCLFYSSCFKWFISYSASLGRARLHPLYSAHVTNMIWFPCLSLLSSGRCLMNTTLILRWCSSLLFPSCCKSFEMQCYVSPNQVCFPRWLPHKAQCLWRTMAGTDALVSWSGHCCGLCKGGGGSVVNHGPCWRHGVHCEPAWHADLRTASLATIGRLCLGPWWKVLICH